jgi:hypothetical protein
MWVLSSSPLSLCLSLSPFFVDLQFPTMYESELKKNMKKKNEPDPPSRP